MGKYLADLPIPDEPVKKEHCEVLNVEGWTPVNTSHVGKLSGLDTLQGWIDQIVPTLWALGIRPIPNNGSLRFDRVYLVSSVGENYDIIEIIETLLDRP